MIGVREDLGYYKVSLLPSKLLLNHSKYEVSWPEKVT